MPKKKKSPLEELVQTHQADPEDLEGGKVRQVMASLDDGQEEDVQGPTPEEVADATYTEQQLAAVARPSGAAYSPRKMDATGKTDVETLRACREADLPVLLSGYPGCGKTAMVEAAFGDDMITVEAHGDTEVADLIGGYLPVSEESLRFKMADNLAEKAKLNKSDREVVAEAARQLPPWGGPPQPVPGKAGELIASLDITADEQGNLLVAAPEGDKPAEILAESWRRAGTKQFEWQDGPLIKAMQSGKVLFVDDITMIPAQVLVRLYPAMDGRKVLRVSEHEGETVEAQEGFFVVGAHNPGAQGAILSEPLSSRFLFQFEVESDFTLAAEMGVSRAVIKAARNMRKRRREGTTSWAPEMRELLAYKRVADKLGRKAAAENLVALAANAGPDAEAAMIEALGNSFPGVEALKLTEDS